jgi:hypothetical protein
LIRNLKNNKISLDMIFEQALKAGMREAIYNFRAKLPGSFKQIAFPGHQP